MKKLLSTLSIISIIGTGASNGLIGSLSNIYVTNNKVSDATDLDISDFTLISNDNIYDAIRYQLATEGNTDSYSIKYDSKINLEIHFGNLLLPENTLAQFGTTYKVTVTVADGDKFYNATTKEVEIPVGLEKTTLDITTFTLTNGDNLYDDLENGALAQAPNGVSLVDIQADQEMFIEAFEGSSTVKLLPKDTKVQAGKSYTVESAVSSKDKFFKESDQDNYTISSQTEINFNKLYIMPNKDIYDSIYNQIADQVNVSDDAIINDQKISVNIYLDNTLLDNYYISKSGLTYKVEVKISENDEYFFETMPNSDSILISTSKIDSDISGFILKSNMGLYDQIWYQLSNPVNIDYYYIKNDENIIIQIYKQGDSTILPVNAIALLDSVYTIKIDISSSDLYYNSSNIERDILCR